MEDAVPEHGLLHGCNIYLDTAPQRVWLADLPAKLRGSCLKSLSCGAAARTAYCKQHGLQVKRFESRRFKLARRDDNGGMGPREGLEATPRILVALSPCGTSRIAFLL